MLAPFDQAILGWLNSYVGSSYLFDEIVRSITGWHFVRAGWLGCFVWWAWFAETDDQRRIKLLSALIAVILIAAVSRGMQTLTFVHLRPFVVADAYGFQIPRNVEPFLTSRSSFPSDTATLYFAMAALVWCISRWWGALAFAWVLLIAALPRVYLTYHWPSDVLAAFVLGTTAVILAYRYCLPGATNLHKFERVRPEFFYPLLFVFIYQIVDAFDLVDRAVLGAMGLAKLALSN
jgi:undecaprenyl-diphosphatase